jgi:hypothetical protein
MSGTHTFWHVRIDDLSEEQLLRFKNNVEYTQYMIIGNIHTKNCYGVGDERNGTPHYHVIFKYNNSRARQTIVNKFILNKGKDCKSYYCEGMYKYSTEEALISYVADKECGLQFTYNEQIIDHILNPKEIIPIEEEIKEVTVSELSARKKMTRVEQYEMLEKERVMRAKAQDWNWFWDNDSKFARSNQFKAFKEHYMITDIKSLDHLRIRGELRRNFIWVYGETRKGKGSFVRWFAKMLNKAIYNKSKADSYWNGFDNEVNQMVWVDEYDGTKECRKTLPVTVINEIWDKDAKKVRAAYNFELMLRFTHSVITSQVHPSKLLFDSEDKFTNPVYEAFCNRFSIIDVKILPDLFSIDYNIEEECWERNELFKVPEHIAKEYPWLVNNNGFPII